MKARLTRWLEFAKSDPRVPWVLFAVLACVGGALALDPAWLHDEGLLSYGFARAIGEAPLAMFFFQKCKPVFALFYALPARFGITFFLGFHALICAAAVPLSASAARAMGAGAPNVAALVVAASPLFVRAGGTGLSNADAVLCGSLVVWLASRERFFLAGVVSGACIWVRYETGVLAIALFVAGIVSPRLRSISLGSAIFPSLYIAAGALYHGDLLWVIHFPPNIAAPVAGMASHTAPFLQHSPATLIRAFACVTPALPLLLLLSPRALGPLPRALLAFVGVFVLAFAFTHVQVLPVGPMFVLGYSERYALALLPAVAPLAAIACDSLPSQRGLRAPLMVLILLVLGLLGRIYVGDRYLLEACLALALSVALARSRLHVVWPLPIAVLLLATIVLTNGFLVDAGFRRSDGLALQAAMLGRHRDRLLGTVFTNSQVLSSYLARTGTLSDLDVRYLLGPDQSYELAVLASGAHAQRETIRRVLPAAVFGPFVDPAELSPSALEPGSTFLLTHEDRRESILPEAVWGPFLEPVEVAGDLELRAARRAPAPTELRP